MIDGDDEGFKLIYKKHRLDKFIDLLKVTYVSLSA